MTVSERFQVELEFVQALANVDYLAHLSRSDVLDEDDFIRFLDYLQYWHEPQYAKHIVYPQCLRMLDLLQEPGFRLALKNPIFVEYARRQTTLHWFHRSSAFRAHPAPAAAASADNDIVKPEEDNAEVGAKRPRFPPAD